MFYPENREQIEAIVRNARQAGISLAAVSSRAPHLHGTSENSKAETVSFEKMNRIIKVDRRSRYVRVEPGVTYSELIPKLAEARMRLNIPLLPRANKSVVSSALERDRVLIPKYQYDYTDPLLTLEAVTGTAEVIRTGSAAGPGNPENSRADMVLPWGPGSIDYLRFFSGAQGTMGLVSWATLKTELLPSLSKLFFVRADSVEALIKLANTLLRNRIPDECIIMNRVNFAGLFAEDETEEAQLLSTSGPWIMLCRICGFDRYPEERLDIYETYLKDLCTRAGLYAETELQGLPGFNEKAELMITDCERRSIYWKLRRGAVREIDMLAPPSRTPLLVSVIQENTFFENTGITLQPQVQGRAFSIACSIFCEDTFSDISSAEKTLGGLSGGLFKAGAYFDRPYGALSVLVYKADPRSTEALKKLKAIFDPDGILNPGKLCF